MPALQPAGAPLSWPDDMQRRSAPFAKEDRMNTTRVAATLLPIALMLGASAATAADPAMIKARQKFFGIENVDANTGAVKKDKVIASWGTNTTYVTSLLGRVVLFDSYITRPELPTSPIDQRYSPLLPQDLIDVQPE